MSLEHDSPIIIIIISSSSVKDNIWTWGSHYKALLHHQSWTGICLPRMRMCLGEISRHMTGRCSSQKRPQLKKEQSAPDETRGGFRQYLIGILRAMQKDTASLKREQSEIREDRCERKACLNLLLNKNGLWVLNGKFVFLLPSQINPWQGTAEHARGCA